MDSTPRGRSDRQAQDPEYRVLPSAPGHDARSQPGILKVTGDVVLLLYPKTFLPPEAGQAILSCLRDQGIVGGGFGVGLYEKVPLLGSFLRWCVLCLSPRCHLLRHQALFARTGTLARVGGVPALVALGHTELCRRLRTEGRLAWADVAAHHAACGPENSSA